MKKYARLGAMSQYRDQLIKSIDNAVERDCTAFQIFTRNPRGWNAKELTK